MCSIALDSKTSQGYVNICKKTSLGKGSLVPRYNLGTREKVRKFAHFSIPAFFTDLMKNLLDCWDYWNRAN